MANRRIVFRAMLNDVLNSLAFVDVMDFGDKRRLAYFKLKVLPLALPLMTPPAERDEPYAGMFIFGRLATTTSIIYTV